MFKSGVFWCHEAVKFAILKLRCTQSIQHEGQRSCFHLVHGAKGLGQNAKKIKQGVELSILRNFERLLSAFQFDNSFVSVRPQAGIATAPPILRFFCYVFSKAVIQSAPSKLRA